MGWGCGQRSADKRESPRLLMPKLLHTVSTCRRGGRGSPVDKFQKSKRGSQILRGTLCLAKSAMRTRALPLSARMNSGNTCIICCFVTFGYLLREPLRALGTRDSAHIKDEKRQLTGARCGLLATWQTADPRARRLEMLKTRKAIRRRSCGQSPKPNRPQRMPVECPCSPQQFLLRNEKSHGHIQKSNGETYHFFHSIPVLGAEIIMVYLDVFKM